MTLYNLVGVSKKQRFLLVYKRVVDKHKTQISLRQRGRVYSGHGKLKLIFAGGSLPAREAQGKLKIWIPREARRKF